MPKQTDYSRALPLGFAGQLADGNRHEAESMRNDEASASIPFGVAVKRGSTTDPSSAKLFTATSEKIAGIVLHAHSYIPEVDLDDDGAVRPDKNLAVARKGKVLAVCEDGCTVGAPLFIRAVAGGAEQAGALRASSDSTDCIDCTAQGQWVTAASAGGLALLEFDFTGQ